MVTEIVHQLIVNELRDGITVIHRRSTGHHPTDETHSDRSDESNVLRLAERFIVVQKIPSIGDVRTSLQRELSRSFECSMGQFVGELER